jgi:hypothetical protein
MISRYEVVVFQLDFLGDVEARLVQNGAAEAHQDETSVNFLSFNLKPLHVQQYVDDHENVAQPAHSGN